MRVLMFVFGFLLCLLALTGCDYKVMSKKDQHMLISTSMRFGYVLGRDSCTDQRTANGFSKDSSF